MIKVNGTNCKNSHGFKSTDVIGVIKFKVQVIPRMSQTFQSTSGLISFKFATILKINSLTGKYSNEIKKRIDAKQCCCFTC